MRLRNDFEEQARLGQVQDSAETERQLKALLASDYEPTDPFRILLETEIDEIQAAWGEAEAARASLQQTVARVESTPGGGELLTLPPRLAIAWSFVAERRWPEAEARADEIAAICRRHKHPLHALGPCRDELLQLYMSTGACRKAAAEFLWYDADSLSANDRRAGLSSAILLGRRYVECGALPEAHWYLNVCADKAPTRPPTESQTVWTSASGDVTLAVVDSAHAFESQAPRCLEDLVPLERLVGHAEQSERIRQRQRELWRTGPDLERALRDRIQRTEQIWRNDIFTADELNTLAWYYRGKERNADAIAAWREASARIDRLVSKYGRHPDAYAAWRHSDILQGLAAACEDGGDLACAEAAWLRASSLVESGEPPSHAWRFDTLAGLARTQLRRGDTARAEASWQHFLRIATEQRGREHAEYARGLRGLADVRDAAGQTDDARRLRAQAASILDAYSRRVDAVVDLPLPAALRSPPSPAN